MAEAKRIAQDAVSFTTTGGAQAVMVAMDSQSVSLTVPGYVFNPIDLRELAAVLIQTAIAMEKRNQ